MNPAVPSRSTKVVFFIAALVCTTFPNGGDDFVLEVIERGRFHIGATLLNWVWISLVSIGLLWLLRQMSGYAKRGGWQQPLSLLGCLVAISVFIGVFRVLLSEKVQPVSVLIFLLIWAGMAVRTLAVVFRSQVPAKPAQNLTTGTPKECLPNDSASPHHSNRPPGVPDLDSAAVAVSSTRLPPPTNWLLIFAVLGAALALYASIGYFLTRDNSQTESRLGRGAKPPHPELELWLFPTLTLPGAENQSALAVPPSRPPLKTAAEPSMTVSAQPAPTARIAPPSHLDSRNTNAVEVALRLTNELIEEATAIRDAYRRECQEIDLDTCVLPSRMKNDPGFVEATDKIRRARAVIAKFKPISMGLMSRFRTKIEILPISSEEKRRCLSAFDLNAREAAKDGVELWALEEGIVDKIEEAVRFLAARDTWVLHDKKISFTKQEDREGFWELIGAIGRIGERQQAIIEKNRAAISASFGETP